MILTHNRGFTKVAHHFRFDLHKIAYLKRCIIHYYYPELPFRKKIFSTNNIHINIIATLTFYFIYYNNMVILLLLIIMLCQHIEMQIEIGENGLAELCVQDFFRNVDGARCVYG